MKVTHYAFINKSSNLISIERDSKLLIQMQFVKECYHGIQVSPITKIRGKIELRFVSAQNSSKTYFTYALNQNVVSYSLFIDSNKLFDTLEEDSGTINLFRSPNLNQGGIKVCSFVLVIRISICS